jgi:hypothetical protein|tara:strand:- start:375 stop:857 length:483 start_codon:yes stop_codon:yes gene_type:complete
MATVAQLAKSALQRIIVQASEAPLEPDEYADFIFTMNAWFAELDGQGIALGYTVVTDIGDEVTIPAAALRGAIANLAIEVAPDYNGIVTPGLAKAARDGFNTIRLVGQSMGRSRFPSTLPIGSGNEGSLYGYSGTFYPDAEKEILAETTGSISLEINTDG